MPEVNSLILNVKSDSVEKGADRLDHLSRSATKAGASQKGLATATGTTSTAMGANAASTKAAAGVTVGYAAATNVAAGVTVGYAAATNVATGATVGYAAATNVATGATVGYAAATNVATGATVALGTALKFALGPSIASVSSRLTLGTGATAGYAASTKGATGATVALGTALKFAIGPIIALVSSMLTLGKVVSIAGDLEHALSGVSAVTGAVGDDLQNLEDVARDLGATTVFSAKQAADGMQFLGMAGFETNEIIAAMPGLLDLAAAGQLELAQASDIATNVLSGFRLEAEEAGRVGDVLAKGAASSNTSVFQLGKALSFTASVSASLGKSLEETAAAIGVLSDNGTQGQRAGTGLRTVLSSLSKVTPIAEEALGKLGLTIADVDVQSQSLQTVFGNLSKAGLDAKAAFKIFGTEGATAALALTSQVDNFQALQESLENAEGAAGEMAITLSNDLHGSYKRLGSVASKFALTLDDAIGASGLWRATIDVLTESINGLSDALGAMSEDGDLGTQSIHVLVAELDRLEDKKKDLGGGALISRVQVRADIIAIRSALGAFSENEIALAKAENQLASFVATEKDLSVEISKGFFESKKAFEERATAQERQRAGATVNIASLKEQIWLLGELIKQEKRRATEDVETPTEADAPIKTATGADGPSKELERLQRQLQTEEEAIEASFLNRLEIIRTNTEKGSALRFDLETRADEELSEARLKIEKRRVDETNAIQRTQFETFQQFSMLSATLVGQIADMAEEGTNAQKALFLVQKGISIAQAIINTELAATRAPAEAGPILGMPLATAIRAMGYASVGVMVGQTIGSFATGGIVPGASFSGDTLTASVNSGEMILNGAQQARLFDIADNKTQTGSGGVNITVENYGSSEITVEQLSENDVRIIARDTARGVVREDAPSVIASDLQSANSRTSRSLSQNTKTERRR